MTELTELKLGKRRNVPHAGSSITNYDHCLICQKRTPGTLQNVTENGFATLCYAVSNRYDDAALRLKEDVQDKVAFLGRKSKCHSTCRNSYTNRKTVDQQKAKRARLESNANQQVDSGSTPICTGTLVTRSKVSKPDYKEVCFVCEKQREKKVTETLFSLLRQTDKTK